jgi:hypothetical protein
MRDWISYTYARHSDGDGVGDGVGNGDGCCRIKSESWGGGWAIIYSLTADG